MIRFSKQRGKNWTEQSNHNRISSNTGAVEAELKFWVFELEGWLSFKDWDWEVSDDFSGCFGVTGIANLIFLYKKYVG